jgi:hypothetical protein
LITRYRSLPASTFLVPRLLVAVVVMLAAAPARASQAVIVEAYHNCALSDTNVVIDEGALSAHESAEVKARIAAAGKDPQAAVARIAQILKNHGIEDIKVSRQGFEGCEPESSGKYVEAVGTYCGAQLKHAEIRVDRKTFMQKNDPKISFAEFLRDAVKRLREKGVFDRPVVSIENAPDCDKSS